MSSEMIEPFQLVGESDLLKILAYLQFTQFKNPTKVFYSKCFHDFVVFYNNNYTFCLQFPAGCKL